METFISAELEYWDGRTGREILLAALTAAEPFVVAESVNLYNREALNHRGDECGEVSLYFAIMLAPGAETEDVWFAIREGARIRCKALSPIPAHVARMSGEEYLAWERAEWERYEAECEAERE
jgi:hypothetical protein